MRIGLLSYEYPPETGFGGIGTYTWYQARALVRLGHEVHVLAGMKEQAPLTTSGHDGVVVHRFRAGGIAMRVFDALGRFRWRWTRQRLENAWSMYHALKGLLRRYKFDVLEMPECGAEGFLINSLVSIPTIVRFHSPSRLIMPFYDVPRADISMCLRLEQRAINRASVLTSCSVFLANEVRDKMGINAPITVIPNGIDVSLFDQRKNSLSADHRLPKGKVTILFAGRMEHRKGIHLCGTIAARILREHDVAFVFAGWDPFGYMKETLLPSLKAQQLKGSVHYLGKLDLAELRSCVCAANVLILPSLWENCPYSCLEGMAAGRAIVSSDQGGMPELIQHGTNGLLAQSGVPESFVQQLEFLIKNRQFRSRLGSAARRSVERQYTDDHMAKLSVDVYAGCLGLSRGFRMAAGGLRS